jgi:thioredoxin 1
MITVMKLYQTHCPPCRMMERPFAELSEKFSDRAQFKNINLDLDDNITYADKYGVMSTPTILILKDDEVIDKIVGFVPYEELESTVAKHL